MRIVLLFPSALSLSTPHSIIGVTTYSAILSSPDAQRDKLTGTKKKLGLHHLTQSSSWSWTLVKLFAVAGVLAGAFYGYRTYALRQGGGGGGLGRGMQGFGYDSKRF